MSQMAGKSLNQWQLAPVCNLGWEIGLQLVVGCLAPGYVMLVSEPLHPANSLPAIAVDCPKEEEEPERGVTLKSSPFLHPEQELLNALMWLSSDDW